MNMIEVKTEELEGFALDWAVAHAVKAWETAHLLFPTMTLDPTFSGVEARLYPRGEYGSMLMTCVLVPNNPFRQDPQPFCPSTDWSQGGPLIEKYSVSIGAHVAGRVNACVGLDVIPYNRVVTSQSGPTHLIAACRAIVAAKLGDVVNVPAERVAATT